MRVRFNPFAADLLAGVMITFAIAWMAALARPLSRELPGLFFADRHGETWMGFGRRGLGWEWRTIYGATGLTDVGRATAESLPRWIVTTGDGPLEHRAVTTIGAGWPMIALRATRTGVGHDQPPPGSNTWRTGLGPQSVEWRPWRGALGASDDSSGAADDGRPLPWHVDALGLAIDMLFWSGVWLLPAFASALRAWARRRRGCCVACGYDLRAASADHCPECGRSLD